MIIYYNSELLTIISHIATNEKVTPFYIYIILKKVEIMHKMKRIKKDYYNNL